MMSIDDNIVSTGRFLYGKNMRGNASFNFFGEWGGVIRMLVQKMNSIWTITCWTRIAGLNGFVINRKRLIDWNKKYVIIREKKRNSNEHLKKKKVGSYWKQYFL